MIRKFLTSTAFIILAFVAYPQSTLTRAEYIETYELLAIQEMQRTGIPASITLAQACLESGNGNSVLSRKSNNHFGIKCKSSWTGKRVYHDDDSKDECFRHYNSVEKSFEDHSNFLLENSRYSSLFTLKLTDYKGWARGLKKAGYATNPKYADQLIEIIEQYELYLYDEGIGEKRMPRIIHNSTSNNVGSLINPYQTRKVTLRNGLKSIVVVSGDTFESVANEFNLKAWEIYRYNDYQEGRKTTENEILYIEPKKKKADKKQSTHIFESDDSMHYISQFYGVKLKSLYRKNRIKQGKQPAVGTVIYLRDKSPK